METVYLIIIIVLGLLAVSDLVVGVSNDAVNFLGSAIGAKVASFKVIIAIAALGVLFGAVFSGGMMEVARNGIFHPEHFFFAEIMCIFLAVMITDIILLDVFNTFGLPTSTTVSIVFELLGAAVGVALLKMNSDSNSLALGEYINSGKALMIIMGILLSVVISFSVGALVQHITRLFFTFNVEKNLKYFGGIFGGSAITAIIYFILVKGAKDVSFIPADTNTWIQNNVLLILGISLVFWTLVLQLFTLFTKLNILKVVVLVGTFALAMAFAGNDLVNFIGVPIAGYHAYEAWTSTAANAAGASADVFSMSALGADKVPTPTLFLILSGIIMVATLWFSKKARTVVKTSVDLSRQDEGSERFGSSFMARSLVGGSKTLTSGILSITPQFIINKFNHQLDDHQYKKRMAALGDNAPAFDLLRASVNLVVASILIAFATSFKLPLSTTYVTFMVAMGTSLADKAWGSDSAVYRITGVISVIGGWFFTALSAFIVALVIALIISWGGFIAIGALLIIALFLIIRSNTIHKKKEQATEQKESSKLESIGEDNIVIHCTANVTDFISRTSNLFGRALDSISAENRKSLREIKKEIGLLNSDVKVLKDNVNRTIMKLRENSHETGHYYVQVIDYMRETAHSLTYICAPGSEHIENHHKGLIGVQIEELADVKHKVAEILEMMRTMIINHNFERITEIVEKQQEALRQINAYRTNQIKRIKTEETGTKNSMLYMAIQFETKNLLLFAINVGKAYRDFAIFDAKKMKEK